MAKIKRRQYGMIHGSHEWDAWKKAQAMYPDETPNFKRAAKALIMKGLTPMTKEVRGKKVLADEATTRQVMKLMENIPDKEK